VSRRLHRLGWLSSLALLGCGWDRFDQLREDTPVLGLETPPQILEDFGATLAALPAGDRTSVLVGGPPGTSVAVVYLVGQDEDARTAPTDDRDYCPASNGSRMCHLAAQPASLQSVRAPDDRAHANCYVTGVGRAVNDLGLWTACEDTAEFAIPVPPDIQAAVVDPALAGSSSPDVVLASEPAIDSALVAGVGDLGRAFYYEPDTTVPLDLVPAFSAPQTFGSTVAVIGAPGGRVLAVGAPGAGEVHFFFSDGTLPVHLGCWSGAGGLGRTLATGDFDGDGTFDVAVSDDTEVHVLSGAELGGLSPATDTSCTLSLDPLLLATLSCENFGEARDCAGSRFGVSLGIADFDGDGAAEVAVGAPRMTVRGLSDAGAVLIFDQSGDVVDARYVSTAAPDQLFGARLATLPQSGRDILAVTAPGASAASIVYCATIAGSGNSPRCP
jgi:hypothetical protein